MQRDAGRLGLRRVAARMRSTSAALRALPGALAGSSHAEVPTSSSPVPRPAPRGRRRALEPTHVLVASDLNPRYVDYWPLARRAWREVAGLEPILVLVAPPE